MQRNEYLQTREDLEEAIERLDAEWLAQHRIAPGVYQTRKDSHNVTIYVKGCETTRDCFCAATDGQGHDEEIFPLVGKDGKTY